MNVYYRCKLIQSFKCRLETHKLSTEINNVKNITSESLKLFEMMVIDLYMTPKRLHFVSFIEKMTRMLSIFLKHDRQLHFPKEGNGSLLKINSSVNTCAFFAVHLHCEVKRYATNKSCSDFL